MIPFTITLSSGSVTADSTVITADSTAVTADAHGQRALQLYTMQPLSRPFARSFVPNVGQIEGHAPLVTLGDGMQVPSEVALTATVEGGSLAGSYALAYQIVQEAETATAVAWHWGSVNVRALLGYDVRPDADRALLTLRFLPSSATPMGGIEEEGGE